MTYLHTVIFDGTVDISYAGATVLLTHDVGHLTDMYILWETQAVQYDLGPNGDPELQNSAPIQPGLKTQASLDGVIYFPESLFDASFETTPSLSVGQTVTNFQGCGFGRYLQVLPAVYGTSTPPGQYPVPQPGHLKITLYYQTDTGLLATP